MDKEKSDRIALFIDAENLIISAQKAGLPVNVRAVIDRIREEGTLSFARAFADWTQSPVFGYTSQFHECVVELTQLSTMFGKNTADIQIVVDSLEMALSEDSPEIFVLIAGDRDFVPLVQKLKRYGKRVIGIGLLDTTSPALNAVCDTFLFYDNLLPEADKAAGADGLYARVPSAAQSANSRKASLREPVSEDLRQAFSVLLRAVMSLERKGEVPLGANLRPLMSQLDPSFDLSRFTYLKFQDFVEEAVQAGFVDYGDPRGEHFTLQSPPVERRPDIQQPISLLKMTFSNSTEALQAYRQVLAQKRVPMIPWNERRQIVRVLWERLEESEIGLTPEQIFRAMLDAVGMHFLNIPEHSVQKLAFTLSLGGCFTENGMPARLDMKAHNPLKPACRLEEALDRMNLTYIRGIKHDQPDIHLQQRALALLLFENDSDDNLVNIDSLLVHVR